jgi:hypothetical protein
MSCMRHSGLLSLKTNFESLRILMKILLPKFLTNNAKSILKQLYKQFCYAMNNYSLKKLKMYWLAVRIDNE